MLHELLQLKRPLIIFDFETTGTEPETARACSIGMRVWRPDGNVYPYRSLINPTIAMPAEAQSAHGITDEMIRIGCAKCWAPQVSHPSEQCAEFKPVPMFEHIADRLYEGFKDADFSGYNVKYDLRVATAEFQRCGITFDYSTAAQIDVKRIWQLLEPRTLSDAVEYFLKRKLVGAHDAMIDVVGTEDVLVNQLTLHPRSSILPRTVQELHDLCWPKEPNAIDGDNKFKFIAGVPCFNFGKWNGKPMRDHHDYLQWMIGPKGGFSPEVKRIADNALSGNYPVQPPQQEESHEGNDSTAE